jgi:hypothetical protein
MMPQQFREIPIWVIRHYRNRGATAAGAAALRGGDLKERWEEQGEVFNKARKSAMEKRA